jgi:tRNA-Thr(GGU) m(6)t(6)A37 methyltransferase TsaA
MKIEFEPIGFVRTGAERVPRHWTVSDVEGTIVVDNKYAKGLRDIKDGQKIIVIFHFHKSPGFTAEYLIQKPPHRDREYGVFSICSPVRPNPIGMSVLEVTDVNRNVIHVKGLDMLDGTPVLDIKPLVESKSKENMQDDQNL